MCVWVFRELNRYIEINTHMTYSQKLTTATGRHIRSPRSALILVQGAAPSTAPAMLTPLSQMTVLTTSRPSRTAMSVLVNLRAGL